MFETTYTKDEKNKQLIVEREFAAPLDRVWQAWTDSTLLDKWWAPKPWKASTKSFEFVEGGRWLYCMTGPQGEKAWSFVEYKSINPKSSYSALDAFCDEEGNINTDFPRMNWDVEFDDSGKNTKVLVTITFTDLESMNKIVAMGFKEGFAMGHSNLDELLAE